MPFRNLTAKVEGFEFVGVLKFNRKGRKGSQREEALYCV